MIILYILTLMEFNSLNCLPNKEHDFSCYTTNSLIYIRDKWNLKTNDNRKIEDDDPKEIWKKLKEYLYNSCKNEKCWLRSNFIKHNLNEELLTYTFAPQKPKSWIKNDSKWLDSNNIIDVMKQYEYKYPEYSFIGPSPVDYNYIKYGNECVWPELCNFDIKHHIQNNVKKIGIIFNTDPHYKSGEHWVSLFINLNSNNHYIFYFDSNGDKIPQKINDFKKNVISQYKKLYDKPLKYINNYNISHQKKDGQCGMYCLYHIVKLIESEDNYILFTDKKNTISDNSVKKLRNIYYNNIE